MGKDQNRRPRGKKNQQRYQRRQEEMETMALERMEDLFQRAWVIANSNPTLAQRYIDQIRRYSMATKVRIPLNLKRYICHHCKQLFVPGTSMRFRIHQQPNYGTYLSVTCLRCGHITRYLVKGPASHNNSTISDARPSNFFQENKENLPK